MLAWLGICAVLALGAATIAALSGVAPAPIFHLLFAVGALPLIFGAIIHFVPVLTRTGPPARVIRLLPLSCQCVVIPVPLALAGRLPEWSLPLAAFILAVVALVLVSWTARRLRATLGQAHAGAHWYGVALLCLFLAVSLVPVWLLLPELRPALRLFHVHLNTLGFIGLAALGTLPVLLPTAMGRPEPGAPGRLRTDLPWAAAGALLVAAGAASGHAVALPGGLLLAGVALRNGVSWWRCYGLKALMADGATSPLALATLGFAGLMLLGVAHGLGWMAARPALEAYVGAFLVPLVMGALSQLLPVWWHPGSASPRRHRLRDRLVWGGQVRALLSLVGGGLLACSSPTGWVAVAGSVLLFCLTLAVAFRLDRLGSSDDNPRPIS